ncbi:hypothetical protein EUX98_g1719 [Antrodiella citrinella]|uniref:Myb/SANT-like domain-containing protein n=1 Tax=Antrodiella citrinella TaxID=2447956 RepID=A0A4S4N0P8_9APHY|nr:hypothetical protein EUX98_g1719 [Antrodiella citrinella]
MANRANWRPSDDAILINFLLDCKIHGDMADNSFKPVAWQGAATKFRDLVGQVGAVKSSQSCKDRAQAIKNNFRIVKRIRDLSGVGWDAQMCTVIASGPVWEAYLATNRKAKYWKTHGFPLYDKCEELWNGTIATGGGALHIAPAQNAAAATVDTIPAVPNTPVVPAAIVPVVPAAIAHDEVADPAIASTMHADPVIAPVTHAALVATTGDTPDDDSIMLNTTPSTATSSARSSSSLSPPSRSSHRPPTSSVSSRSPTSAASSPAPTKSKSTTAAMDHIASAMTKVADSLAADGVGDFPSTPERRKTAIHKIKQDPLLNSPTKKRDRVSFIGCVTTNIAVADSYMELYGSDDDELRGDFIQDILQRRT